MGLGLRQGKGVEVVLEVGVEVVVGLSQHYKAEGCVYPGGRIEFRKAAEQKDKLPAALGCPIRCRRIYSPPSPGVPGWGAGAGAR